MKNTPIAGCLAAAFMTCAVPAAAQDGSWDTSFTFCLWTVETDTSISTALGTIESTLPFSDALDNLDFAFMGSVEARNGRWSLIGDLAHTIFRFPAIH